MARDNTVKYHWRVMQLLPGAERPSYAGLRVDVLERANGELMIRYQGEPIDYQEGPPPSSAVWGVASACSPGPEHQEGADGVAGSHLDTPQRERLAALESSESSDDNEANDKEVATRGRGRKTKPGSPPVASDAHGDPAGSLGGSPTGQEAGAFPPGYSPETGHGPKHRRKVRFGGVSAHKETQCQGACRSRGPGRITNLRRLNRVTHSLFKLGDGIAGQQHIGFCQRFCNRVFQPPTGRTAGASEQAPGSWYDSPRALPGWRSVG